MLFGNFNEPSLSERILRARVMRQVLSLSEEKYYETENEDRSHDIIVMFSGDGHHFADLVGDHTLLLDEIRNRVRRDILRRVDQTGAPHIVLNVRLARDFRRPTTREDFVNGGALLTPVDWFRSVLSHLRNVTGVQAPALVISDGSAAELEPLLAMPNVSRLASSSAVEDLLTMSRAKIIIGSGGSSFSAWGAYLAQAHVITIGGQSLSWFALNQATTGHVIELGAGQINVSLPDEIYNDVI